MSASPRLVVPGLLLCVRNSSLFRIRPLVPVHLVTRSFDDRVESYNPPDPNKKYTDVEESNAEFKFVERLLPTFTVPKPPLRSLLHFPTPSGWIPPATEIPNLPYYVGRTRWHNLPVYLETKGGLKHMTKIIRVQGDIWRLHNDLRSYLTACAFDEYFGSQVDEIGRKLRFKGDFVETVKKFLLEKGF